MQANNKIDFSDVAALTRLLGQKKSSRSRFSLDLSERDCSNAIYAAMKVEVESRGFAFRLDNDTRSHIEAVARWLVDSHGKPGLLLRGDVGNGKTSLATAVINLIEFVTELQDGYGNRKKVLSLTAKKISRYVMTEEGRKTYEKLLVAPMLAIDELGEEPTEVMSYGMLYEPMKDLLLERYDRQLFTIATSNLGADQMRDKYSSRVTDRFREMMEVVNFKNPSYR